MLSTRERLRFNVFDGTSGALLGGADMTGVSGGNFAINMVGVADDGAFYSANLTTAVSSGSPYKIYRWTDFASAPTVAFVGDASAGLTFTGKRIGDTMAIRGSGTSTEILAPFNSTVTPTTNVVLFSTTDGVNFTNTVVQISGLGALASGGGPNFGVCFYTNNTFLFKPSGSFVYVVQFPTDFAASAGGAVTGTVIGTNALSGGTVALDCNVSAGLTAAFGTIPNAAPTTVPISLYAVPPATGFATVLAATNSAHNVANGNYAGTVALGGAGKTNYIYSLDCNNGLTATLIIYTAGPQAPVIITQPVGGTGFAPFKLTVIANGADPLSYQWQVTNSAAAGSFTNIPGATTNFYIVTDAVTNFYRVIVANNIDSKTSTVVQVTTTLPITNPAVSPLWTLAAGQAGYSWLSPSDNNERGIAYDSNSQDVVVATTSGLHILNGNNGTELGTLDLTGVAFGGLLGGCDQVGIADDGAVYAGNLINGGGNFNLYRWSAPTNTVTATQAYTGDPSSGSNDRWGDNMAVRGAGAYTQILLASKGTNVVLFTTSDGVNFSPTLIGIANVPSGFAGNGISFGAGNTLWAKSYLGDLWEVSFDPVGLTGSVLLHYAQPSQISGSLVGVGIDPANNILAGVALNDNPNNVQLFQLTGTSDAPVLFHQAFFSSANANGNANAAIAMKYPRLYALDVNNGIVALTYGVPSATPASIVHPPTDITTYTNAPSVTFTVDASGSLPLYYQWRFNSNDIAGATSRTYTITNLALSAAGYYDVVVHNISQSVTSAPPALLTLLIPATSTVVTQLWTLPAGSESFLDGSTYNTRGLAYSPGAGSVLVADHYNIYLLDATNGNYLGQLNTAGLPTSGVNGWTIDQIGVADDGALYACNLSLTGPGFSIVAWPTINPGDPAVTYSFGGPTGADPAGTGDRWGDTMAVRGSGTGTQILLGSYNGTNVVLLTTSDGTTFTPTVIAVTNSSVPLGFSGLGIAFGAGNTFWAKGGHNYNLRQVAFDAGTGIGTVVQTYTAGTQVPNDLTGLGVDAANHILAGVCFNDSPTDLQLYRLSGNTTPPALFNQTFFGSNNANSQENAVSVLSGGKGFALNVNNGLVAFSYGPLPASPAIAITSITSPATHTYKITFDSFTGYNYQVQYKNALTDSTWTDIGPLTPGGNSPASYTDGTATNGARFYRVISQ